MIVILSSLLLAAAPVGGQTASAPASPAAAKPKPICRRVEETGSIMPGKRTCHTLAEWKQIDAANAKQVEQFRDQANNGRGTN